MGGMRFRKLRIAWLVMWGVATVLLIVLWMRSYRHEDYFYWHIAPSRTLLIGSTRGRLGGDMAHFEVARSRFRFLEKWEVDMVLELGWTEVAPLLDSNSYSPILAANSRTLVISHWLLALIMGMLASAPWLRCRFSLRTLLIVTTLVAVLLGLIVWLSARPPAAPPLNHVDVPEF
jgi:hypothetical protein